MLMLMSFKGIVFMLDSLISVRLLIRPNKKIPVFRVTQPYINLLVKPRIFFRFSGKKNNFIHFERQNLFKIHKIVFFFPEKKKKNMCSYPT